MLFIQPCLMRRNTDKLRQKLVGLGYKDSPINATDLRKHGLICRDKVILGIVEDGWEFNLQDYLNKNKNIIDCGENEELFLALAALRDDTDANQWFIIDVEVYANLNAGDWFIATEIGGGHHVGTNIEPWYYHKATVKEIIKYFKNIKS